MGKSPQAILAEEGGEAQRTYWVRVVGGFERRRLTEKEKKRQREKSPLPRTK